MVVVAAAEDRSVVSVAVESSGISGYDKRVVFDIEPESQSRPFRDDAFGAVALFMCESPDTFYPAFTGAEYRQCREGGEEVRAVSGIECKRLQFAGKLQQGFIGLRGVGFNAFQNQFCAFCRTASTRSQYGRCFQECRAAPVGFDLRLDRCVGLSGRNGE